MLPHVLPVPLKTFHMICLKIDDFSQFQQNHFQITNVAINWNDII